MSKVKYYNTNTYYNENTHFLVQEHMSYILAEIPYKGIQVADEISFSFLFFYFDRLCRIS